MKMYAKSARLISIVCDGPAMEAANVKGINDAEQLFRRNWPDDMAIRESFLVAYLNQKNDVLALFVVSSGGVTGTVVDPKLIIGPALQIAGCTGIIIAHNHPSGSAKPSDADKSITKKLRAAAQLFDIRLLDHVILAADNYLSFADEGIL